MRRLSLLSRLAVLALLPLVAACTENIEGGAACPQLCPTENAPVRDTTLDAVVLDSSLVGYPLPGEPRYLLLAVRPAPDTLDVRTIVRFDTLPARYFPTGAADSVAITRVDSGFLRIHFDTTSDVLARGTTISAYDVDTPAGTVDTSTAALNALFVPARLLGSITIDSTGVTTDSLRIPIASATIAARAQAAGRLRIGLRVTSRAPAQLRIVSSQGGLVANQAHLSFDPVSATDTTYSPIVLTPTSATPAEASIAAGLHDFSIVAAGAVPSFGADLLVGGLPGRRTFLRFNVPSRLVDSSTIVRATLLLSQRPVPGAARTDTVQLETDAVVAEQSVVDLRRSADLALPGASFGIDTLRLSPADSGARAISIVSLVRAWRTLPSTTQRALVLRATLEGAQAGALRFYSTEGPAAQRPRLRISYISRTEFALP